MVELTLATACRQHQERPASLLPLTTRRTPQHPAPSGQVFPILAVHLLTVAGLRDGLHGDTAAGSLARWSACWSAYVVNIDASHRHQTREEVVGVSAGASHRDLQQLLHDTEGL